MTYLKSKKKLVFHSDFGYLEGDGGEHPPPPLNVYFNPTANRVKLDFTIVKTSISKIVFKNFDPILNIEY